MKPFRVSSRELKTALNAVIPLAEPKNGTRPVLNRVRVSYSGGSLYLTATDAYVLGIAKVEVHMDPPEDGSFSTLVIPLDRAKRTAASLPSRGAVALDQDATGTVTLSGDDVVSIDTWTGTGENYPTLERVLSTATTPRASAVSISTALFGRFAKAEKAYGSAVLYQNAEKEDSGILLDMGSRFIGMVMPRSGVDTSHPNLSQFTGIGL